MRYVSVRESTACGLLLCRSAGPLAAHLRYSATHLDVICIGVVLRYHQYTA